MVNIQCTCSIFSVGKDGNDMEKIEVGEVFTITDENDQEQEVEVLGVMDVEGAEYIAVGFVEELQEDTEEDLNVFFFRVEEDGELSYIEDDNEFDKVSTAFDGVLEEQQ
jgi:uncharacterized protein YrzB (UPF0473 family)